MMDGLRLTHWNYLSISRERASERTSGRNPLECGSVAAVLESGCHFLSQIEIRSAFWDGERSCASSPCNHIINNYNQHHPHQCSGEQQLREGERERERELDRLSYSLHISVFIFLSQF